jgi:hypothetical protein
MAGVMTDSDDGGFGGSTAGDDVSAFVGDDVSAFVLRSNAGGAMGRNGVLGGLIEIGFRFSADAGAGDAGPVAPVAGSAGSDRPAARKNGGVGCASGAGRAGTMDCGASDAAPGLAADLSVRRRSGGGARSGGGVRVN